MKTHKNTLLSLMCTIVSFVLLFSFQLIDSGYLYIFYIPLVFALWFGFRSNKVKESSWAGNLVLVIAILSLFYPVLELPIAYMLSGTIFNLSN